MSVDELEDGFDWLAGEVYNDREFARRKRHYMDLAKLRSQTPGRTAA